MARVDKLAFSFRAIAGTVLSGIQAVKLDSNGQVVLAGTNVGEAVGITFVAGTITAGRPVSVLVKGEIVEFGGSIGSAYFAIGGGSVGLTPATGTRIGFTTDDDRLIVTM